MEKEEIVCIPHSVHRLLVRFCPFHFRLITVVSSLPDVSYEIDTTTNCCCPFLLFPSLQNMDNSVSVTFYSFECNLTFRVFI